MQSAIYETQAYLEGQAERRPRDVAHVFRGSVMHMRQASIKAHLNGEERVALGPNGWATVVRRHAQRFMLLMLYKENCGRPNSKAILWQRKTGPSQANATLNCFWYRALVINCGKTFGNS